MYATVAELVEFLGLSAPPAGAVRLLQRASRDVDGAIITAVYGTGEGGAATDPGVIAALRAATLEQASYRRTAGDDGGPGQWASVAIGSANLSRRTDTATPAEATVGRLGADAWQVLQQAGLTGQEPWSR